MRIIHEDQASITARHRPVEAVFGSAVFLIVGVMFLIPAISSQKAPVQFWLFPAVFGGIGILSLLFATSVTVVLDKSSGQGSIVRKRIIGRREETFALDAVKEMRHEKTVHYGKRSSKQVSRIAFVLNDGRHIEVKFPGRGFRGSEVGARMAAFLGVPFTDIRPPTMREAFANVRGAIKDAIDKKNQSKGTSGGENMPPPILK